MHVLTKIFVVLVSLLSVLLVPLVVVYAHNEDSFKSKYESASADAAVANQNLQRVEAAHANEVARLQGLLNDANAANRDVARERELAQAEVMKLEGELAEAKSKQAEIRADLATISTAVASGQDLNSTLVDELRSIRTEAMAAERRAVELDEALRDLSGQLESAVAARRAMQEELQQIKDEHARALEKIGVYAQKYGQLEGMDLQRGNVRPTVDLDAQVLSVSRSSDQTLAEINAGSRDGVEEGWVMTIGRSGNFLGNLRIIAVDINRATGVVELEDPEGRGQVEAGDRVYARRGHG